MRFVPIKTEEQQTALMLHRTRQLLMRQRTMPAAIPAAVTGRTRDRTRPVLQNVRKFLPGRRPHVTQL
jgi:hypothetical protein